MILEDKRRLSIIQICYTILYVNLYQVLIKSKYFSLFSTYKSDQLISCTNNNKCYVMLELTA